MSSFAQRVYAQVSGRDAQRVSAQVDTFARANVTRFAIWAGANSDALFRRFVVSDHQDHYDFLQTTFEREHGLAVAHPDYNGAHALRI